MAVALSITVQGLDELHERLNRISPSKNSAWVARSLKKCAELTQDITANEMIIRGGRFRGPKGKRGGKGKMRSAGVDPKRITSRTGTLRRSIRVNTSTLPFAAEVGSDLVYAAVHEFGGTYSIPSYSRAIATSTRSGGSSMALVKAHSATYPARPYLAPGLDKAAKSFSDIFAKELGKVLA